MTMHPLIAVSLAVALLLAPAGAAANDGAPLRDPLEPAGYVPPGSGGAPMPVARGEGPLWQVSMTLVSPNRQVAIINGSRVVPGDTIQEAEVKEITDLGIVLQLEGEEKLVRRSSCFSIVMENGRRVVRNVPNCQSGAAETASGYHEIPLGRGGGTFTLPVILNNKVTETFVLDTGAADVTMPMDVALQLMTRQEYQSLPKRKYSVADGGTVEGRVFKLKSVTIGDVTISDVIASVGNMGVPMLLGMTFLSRLDTWRLDANRQMLVVGER